MAKQYVAVSKRALIQRINRQLRNEGGVLKATRGERGRQDVGDYYIVNDRNILVETWVDLGEKGRELRVLARYERLEEKQ